MGAIDVEQFAEMARELVEPLGRRWRHVQAVAACARQVAGASGLEGEVLESAAWLHDIGYAPDLEGTELHPVDGARYLRRRGVDERIVSLVAHHSFARHEAFIREIADEFMREIPMPPREYEDALRYCDMTTGPAGDCVDAGDRLDEIQERYGPGHPVTEFVDVARPDILVGVAQRGRTDAAQRIAGICPLR